MKKIKNKINVWHVYQIGMWTGITYVITGYDLMTSICNMSNIWNIMWYSQPNIEIKIKCILHKHISILIK